MRVSRLFIAVGAAATAVASTAVTSASDGPPQEQVSFWIGIGSGVLGLFVALTTLMDTYRRALRQEQLAVAASQARLVRAEGHLVHALHRQAGSSLFNDTFLSDLERPPHIRFGQLSC